MRPTSSGDSAANLSHPPRFRKTPNGEPSTQLSSPAPACGPTSFFLRSEEDILQSNNEAEPEKDKEPREDKDQNYGVQSIEEMLAAPFGSDKEGGCTAGSPAISVPLVAPSQPFTPVQFELSPGPASELPSTPKSVSLRSLRLSDDDSQADEAASQALASSEDEDDEDKQEQEDGDSIPQLVMPSIQMPTRRPFTDRGKNLGKLKVLVAGGAGVGKTSLIKSIVQQCEDIVHVDPLTTTPPIIQAPDPSKLKSRRKRQRGEGTAHIVEVYASTRAYPPWWSDLEESRVLRRRKSMGDTVLERNLCFVDTPGFDAPKTSQVQMDNVVQYVESLLHKNASITSMSDGDLLGILSGNGGFQIDVVFYLLKPSQDPYLSRDVENMRRLADLTNVIPIISHADVFGREKIASFKATVLQRFDAAAIRPFLFGKSTQEALIAAQLASEELSRPQQDVNPFDRPGTSFTPGPFAITSASASDHEVMDASLLMSPDYVQPLVPSELAALVDQVFCQDTAAWLRHAAAKKFLRWRNERVQGESLNMGLRFNSNVGVSKAGSQFVPTSLAPFSASSSVLSSPPASQVLIPRPTTSGSGFSSSPFSASPSVNLSCSSVSSPAHDYTLARLADHTQREERLAQVHLAKWAADLQRSIRNERRRFEELERNKRSQWLLDQVGKEVLDGRIGPSPDVASFRTLTDLKEATGGPAWSLTRQTGLDARMRKESLWSSRRRGSAMDPRDPLGLCEWGDEVKKGGWVVVQLLGGVGMVSALAVAVWQWKNQGMISLPIDLGSWWSSE
ncbi:uncharacterized protein J3D65DRAFT_343483 [Phyllosticta citribraziliensis]|uniref:Septin-type G domain-containing protein n=1 Tax=Phyllosticta citribraziliensis TaxID=989973 RepID=A0ABR1LU81_9PEZI